MAHLTTKQLSAAPAQDMQADIVVVGAGVSGLYATYQLLKKNPNQKIYIVEQLNRIGGRLDSDNIKFPKEMMGDNKEQVVKEEQGGMRFTFDTMDNLMALIQELELEDDIVPFPMSSGGNNRLCFRGESFTNAKSAENDYEIWSKLYNLAPQESGINPKSIINSVFNRILSVNPQFTLRPKHRAPDFWQRFRLECQWKGVRLIDWQMQGLFTDMGYSKELINLLYRLVGFNGIFLSNVNAGVGYQLLEDFPSDPKFKTFKNGFSTLINGLAQAINKVKGDSDAEERIFLKTMVNSVEKEGEEFIVHYTHTDVKGQKKPGRILAKKVILGLPRTALEKLFLGSSVFNEVGTETSSKLWNTLQATENYPLLKINLFYEKAWWGKQISGQPPVDYGPNFSDLPLGSAYPFYIVDERIAAALEYARWLRTHNKPIPPEIQQVLDSKFNAPAALTIYCDYMNINFWKGLQNQGDYFESPMQKKHKKLEAASKAVVRQATKFFKELFNTHYVPEPVLTSTRIWSGSNYFPESASKRKGDKNTKYQPYGYAVHFWGMGAEDDKVMQALIKPMTDQPIYTCNEAYSDYQGWVEGALRSTNLVLQHPDFKATTIVQDYVKSHDELPDVGIKKTYWKNYVAFIKKEFGVDLSNEPNPYLDEADKNKPVGQQQMLHGEFIGEEQVFNGQQQQMPAPNFGQDLSYFD